MPAASNFHEIFSRDCSISRPYLDFCSLEDQALPTAATIGKPEQSLNEPRRTLQELILLMAGKLNLIPDTRTVASQ